jgi:modification methylase fokI
MRFIGCKTLLLNNIKELIDRKTPKAESFCDIFSGTATVARFFKQWYKIISNDILYFSYVLQKATIENNEELIFGGLKKEGIVNPIDYLNNSSIEDMEALPKEKRFFQNTYSPNGGRMYVNDQNALRIDFMRNKVEDWYEIGKINTNEYYYLVACLVEGIPFVSNISGTYGAYHKTWEKRSFKVYEAYKLDVPVNNKCNKSYNEDGVELLKRVSGDILYIDPPYNSRQYLSNYHVLETAAKYDFPLVKGVTGQRVDENGKSDFCQKGKVYDAFSDLIKNAQFKHIILSYSTEGLMDITEITRIMKEYGKKDTFEITVVPYRRYKSRSELNMKNQLSELLIYIEKEV